MCSYGKNDFNSVRITLKAANPLKITFKFHATLSANSENCVSLRWGYKQGIYIWVGGDKMTSGYISNLQIL